MRFFFLLFVAFWGLLSANNLEYRYSYIPKSVYQNQIFPITIFAKNATLSKPVITFDKESTLKPLNSKVIKKIAQKDIFYTFYFKAKGSRIKLPSFWVSSDSGSLVLNSISIPLKSLNSGKEFSGVMASNFQIIDYKFSPKADTVVISIQATQANLEDFSIPNLKSRKVISFSRRGARAEAKFSFYIPDGSAYLSFSYFDIMKHKFIPVNISSAKSTNALANRELNPKDSGFMQFKKYSFSILSIFFIVMFIIYRDYFYLILFIITMLLLLTFFAPLKKLCLKKGAKVYILPIKNSTICRIVKDKGEFTTYHKYKNFNKIEYKNGVIGWVKNEDLCED